MMDDLLTHYVALEKVYINHALASGFAKDKETFIQVVQRETEIERKLAEGQIDEKQAQSEKEEIHDDEDLDHDLVDDFCLILGESTKRALSTLSLFHSCALLNFVIDDILGSQFLKYFDISLM